MKIDRIFKSLQSGVNYRERFIKIANVQIFTNDYKYVTQAKLEYVM